MMVLGRITAPYGIKGWVHIRAFGDDPARWAEMPTWWVSDSDNTDAQYWRPLSLKQLKPHKQSFIALFNDSDDRTAAEQLQGLYIGAPRDAMPATETDEYYWDDLIGLTVENQQGILLGTVTQLISTGAHDVLCINDQIQERLIPFVKSCVPDIDLVNRKIVVDWQPDW